MKLTLKRDLPLLLAALLVIWGLWYARPIGVETLYPELEPDIIRRESITRRSISALLIFWIFRPKAMLLYTVMWGHRA